MEERNVGTGTCEVFRGVGGSRYHYSLTAAGEKRVLIWLARRLPERIHSDHLTAVSLGSSLAMAVVFGLTPMWPSAPLLVVPLLVLNWLGDSLDGTVARVRNQQRPRYGFYVDHVIDIIGMAALGVGLGTSGLMSPVVALGVALTYVLVAAESFLATHTTGTFRMSFAAFGPTELRLVLAAGAIKAAWSPWIAVGGTDILLFDAGGAIAIAGMSLAFLAFAIRNTRLLFNAEPRGANPRGRHGGTRS
jgi:archaetidylinositol phosphate synthase